MLLRVKHLREQIKNLPDDALFEIDISDGRIGERSMSDDFRHKRDVEFGVAKNRGNKIFYINVPYLPMRNL